MQKVFAFAILALSFANFFQGEPQRQFSDVRVQTSEVLFVSDLQLPLPSGIFQQHADVQEQDAETRFLALARSKTVLLRDGLEERKVSTQAVTVGDFLVEQQIALGPLDRITPQVDEPIIFDQGIQITRVEEGEVVETQSIPSQREIVSDATLLYGREIIDKQGEDGTKEITYFVRRENGRQVVRRKLHEQVITQPSPTIIRQGTKIVVTAQEEGRASWYAYKNCLCAAHPRFPKGTFLRVTSLASGRQVIVRVNDFGPDTTRHPDRVIDLDAEAFKQIASLGAGTVHVRVERLE